MRCRGRERLHALDAGAVERSTYLVADCELTCTIPTAIC